MATLTIQTPTKTGAAITRAAVTSGGDVFPNNGRTYLDFVNGGAVGSVVVTIATPATINGLAIADVTLTIPKTTGNEFIAGPFDPNLFNNSGGQVALTYSGNGADIAATTVAAISL